MVLNVSAGQGGLPGPRGALYFDFVVAERPIYIPGSGPPLAPITIMPPHDMKGIIIDEIKLGGSRDSWRYIVTYDNEPALRMSIKPERILNYVSARTYEKYMADKEAMANLPAKDLRRLQREQEKLFLSRPAKRGRKRQHLDTTEEETPDSELSTSRAELARSPVVPPGSAGRKRKLERAEEPTFASPQSQKSRQPSFSTPSKQRGLAELVPSESEEENDDTFTTEIALQRQLNEDETDNTVMDDAFDDTLATEAALERQFGENMRRQTGFLSLQISSPSTSPERTESKARAEVFIKPNKPRSAKDFKGQTRGSSTPLSNGNDNDNESRRHNHPTSASAQPRRDSVASLSSREAAMIYEDLEKKKKARKGSIAERHSRFFSESPDSIASKSTPKPQKTATPPTKKRKASASPSALEDEVNAISVGDDENDEYEVEDILDDEWREDKDSKTGRTRYYLIKWVGDYDNTWEPKVNVGSDVRADYEKRRRLQKLRKKREERSMSHDSRRGANGKPKAKSHTPTINYESEEESLFIPVRPRARSAVVTIGREKGNGKEKEIEMPPPPKQGEVIDDDDAGDSN